MASVVATKRLRKELANLQKDPPPGIIAEPEESNILNWYFCIQGPSETPYEGGEYIGKLKFAPEYPMKPPSILMCTPSARFAVNTKICMSMSDFHPELWNPMWSVATILTGVVSFMTSEELTTGGLRAPESERKRLAGLSKEYNRKHFGALFDGDIDAAFAKAEEARKVAAKENASKAAAKSASTTGRLRKTATTSKKETESSSDKQEEEKEAEELTPEQIEKRRLKNAKKRAKQKAKKKAEATAQEEGDAAEEE